MGNNSQPQKKPSPPSLEEQIIGLRIQSKQLKRSADKALKKSEESMKKAKKSIKSGNDEEGKILCNIAIQSKSNSKNYLKMAYHLENLSNMIKDGKDIREIMGDAISNLPNMLSGDLDDNLLRKIPDFNHAMDQIMVNKGMTNDIFNRISEPNQEENSNDLFKQLQNEVLYDTNQAGPVKQEIQQKEENKQTDDFYQFLKK